MNKVVAWLHRHHTTAYVITDTVKQLWVKAGRPSYVKNYTVPLYFGESLAAPESARPEALPKEPTPAMLKAVSSILDPYPAKLVWERMLEAARSPQQESDGKKA